MPEIKDGQLLLQKPRLGLKFDEKAIHSFLASVALLWPVPSLFTWIGIWPQTAVFLR